MVTSAVAPIGALMAGAGRRMINAGGTAVKTVANGRCVTIASVESTNQDFRKVMRLHAHCAHKS